jgi:hypothetical protein
VKFSVKLSFYYSPKPRKPAIVPAVHAQMIAQNIGWHLRKILSYRCSTTLVFKVLWGSIEIFGVTHSKTGANELKSGDVAPRSHVGRTRARVHTTTWRHAILDVRPLPRDLDPEAAWVSHVAHRFTRMSPQAPDPSPRPLPARHA